MKTPSIETLRRLLVSLKKHIDDDFRAFDDSSEDDEPSMCVTVACDELGNWSYQTGDNSFMGAAYGLPFWSVVYLTRRCNCLEVARDAVDQLKEAQAY